MWNVLGLLYFFECAPFRITKAGVTNEGDEAAASPKGANFRFPTPPPPRLDLFSLVPSVVNIVYVTYQSELPRLCLLSKLSHLRGFHRFK